MIDQLIHLVWKLCELAITLAIAWWVLSWFGITDALTDALTDACKKALRWWARRGARARITPPAPPRAPRKRVQAPRMLRDEQGRFAEKVPDPTDPHDPEELARIEAELERELRRGRR